MARKFESDYRLRERDDVLARLNQLLRDIDLRVDAIELLGQAFANGNRLDVDALVKTINDDFAQKSADLAEMLIEFESGLTPDRITETAEKRFTSDAEVDSLLGATAAVAAALANGLAQKLNSATFTAHRDDKNNPHGVTKAQVGLSKVEDLAPDEMPVSEPQSKLIASRASKNANLSDLENAAAALTNIGAVAKAGDTVTGEIKASNDRNFRMMNGNRGVFWHLNAEDLYLMITDPGDQHGSWNGTRAIRVRLSDGFVWLDRAKSNTDFGVGGAMVHTDGNVSGSRWQSWGNSYAFDAISSRIEDRSFWRTQDYIANSGSGEVGTLGFFYCWRALNPGNLVAGGDIQWASGQGNPYSNPAGTWRCLGLIHTDRGQGSTLFARVS